MKALLAVAIALVVVVGLGGCWGPQKVTRTFDDWLNDGYTGSPWLYGNTLSYMAWGAGFLGTNLVDAGINAYYFWARDAWIAVDDEVRTRMSRRM